MAQETYKLSHLGKTDLLGEIYNRYGKKLYAYAIRTWNVTEDEAWSLIYKTLYKVIDTLGNYTFETEEKFASFVFRIFINYLRNHYRDTKAKEDGFSTTDLEKAEGQISRSQQQTETVVNPKLQALDEELDKMEDWQRMLLLLRSEGMAYNQIATFIDKPENQLKVYYQRLKEQLTKRLHERV